MKQFARLILVLLSFLNACSQERNAELTQSENTLTYKFNKHINYALEPSFYKVYNTDSLIKEAGMHLGEPYKSAGKTIKGFDCSGFVFFIYKRYGVYLPYSSEEMSAIGTLVDTSHFMKGDLIFFKGGNKRSKKVGHVGIVVSSPPEPLMYIHASSSRGVKYDVLNSNKYFKQRFMFIKRIL